MGTPLARTASVMASASARFTTTGRAKWLEFAWASQRHPSPSPAVQVAARCPSDGTSTPRPPRQAGDATDPLKMQSRMATPPDDPRSEQQPHYRFPPSSPPRWVCGDLPAPRSSTGRALRPDHLWKLADAAAPQRDPGPVARGRDCAFRRHPRRRRLPGDPTEKGRAQDRRGPRIPVHGKTDRVPIETSTADKVGWS